MKRDHGQWTEFLGTLYLDIPVLNELDLVGGFSFEDSVIEGIDFHCSNIVSFI